MSELTARDKVTIDELILNQRMLQAVKHYRSVTGDSINDGAEAIYRRKAELMVQFPGRFPTDTDRCAEAVRRLRALSAVAAIEGSWDGDSEGWFVELRAITEDTPLAAGRRGCGLCQIRDYERQEERALAFGRELAAAVGVPFRMDNTDKPGQRPGRVP